VYDGASYRYVVTATNGAAIEGPQANSTPFSSIGIPQVPGRPSVTTPSPDQSAVVRVSVGDSRAGAFTQLQWRNSNGRTDTVSCGCPEGSVRQWTITNLGLTNQTLQVRAFNGTNWSDWSQSSNNYQPFTTTKTPNNLNGTRSNNRITWRWNFPESGREVDRIDIGLRTNEPGAAFAVGDFPNTSYALTGKPGYWYELRLRAHTPDGGGWSDYTAWERVSIPDPQPDVNVSKGAAGQSGTGTCSAPGARCWKVNVSISNFPPNSSWNVRCSSTNAGSFDSGANLNVSGSGDSYSWNGNCYFGTNVGTVTVTLSNGTGSHSGSVNWG
jgi:hypothetical protein